MKKYLLSTALALIIQSGFSAAAEDIAPSVQSHHSVQTNTLNMRTLNSQEELNQIVKNWTSPTFKIDHVSHQSLIDTINSIRHEEPSFSLPMVKTFETKGTLLWREEGAQILKTILSLFPNLSSLRLLKVGLDLHTASAIVRATPRLTELLLDTGSHANVGALEDKGVKILCEGLPHISRLTIGYQHFITDAAVDYIVKAYPSITHLTLRFNDITDVGAHKIAENCTKLQYLNLQGNNLTPEGISFLEFHPNLAETETHLRYPLVGLI